MPNARLEAARKRITAEVSNSRGEAERALGEHAAHVQKTRSFYDDAEEKQMIPFAELESARKAIDNAERELRSIVRKTLASIDAQAKEAISALARQGD